MFTEITGTIDHRILLNYRIDPAVLRPILPEGFEPILVNGHAMGGICQVSLSNMRPKGMPPLIRTRSHNAAHRIAVTTPNGEGVYVPRRDTNSWLNTMSGGRLFPGGYDRATFNMDIDDTQYRVEIHSRAGKRLMYVDAIIASDLPKGSLFSDVRDASSFFERGGVGWSPDGKTDTLDAIALETRTWNMKPLHVREEYSGYFSDVSLFPEGSVEFDCALLMRDIEHSWVSKTELNAVCC